MFKNNFPFITYLFQIVYIGLHHKWNPWQILVHQLHPPCINPSSNSIFPNKFLWKNKISLSQEIQSVQKVKWPQLSHICAKCWPFVIYFNLPVNTTVFFIFFFSQNRIEFKCLHHRIGYMILKGYCTSLRCPRSFSTRNF